MFSHFTEPRRQSRVSFWRGFSASPSRAMAASSSGGGVLKELVHPNFNDTLKSHNGVSFKLVKTGEHNNFVDNDDDYAQIFILFSVWFHRIIGSTLWEARRRIAASRDELPQEKWRVAKRGEDASFFLQFNHRTLYKYQYLIQFLCSVLPASPQCSMHGKLFCRKSKPIRSQLVNFPTCYRNR